MFPTSPRRGLAPKTAVRLALAAVVLLGFTASLSNAQSDDFEPKFKPTLTVQPTSGSIEVDGRLDDSGWRDAARVDGFAEVQPGDQVAPPVESEAWMTYDSENLYVALIAYDDPATVRASMSDRDNIYSDDYFGIMLDTYGDQSWGYELFVNPLGIQGDLRMLNEGGEDGSFDIVWHSEGRITDEGYVVEIAVPFSSLRFPDRDEQRWRLNFWRDHQRDLRRRYAWAAQDRDDPCFMCQWGYVEGIRGIKPGRNVELIASAVGSQFGALVDRSDPGSDFTNEEANATLSLNAKYGLTSSSSAELALNPDFSQIESDAGQINANNTFALFFPERRPFFQEGSDLYNMWISAIYTRSINDPFGAAKVTGQFGRTSVYYLVAQDDNSPIILPGEERSFLRQGENSFSNILRARQTFLEDSYVGLTVTDRRFQEDDAASNTVFGLDLKHRITRQIQIEAQGMISHTAEPDLGADIDSSLVDRTFNEGTHTYVNDGESFTGAGAYVSLERNGRTWNSDVDYWEYDPNFRTDNGFTIQNNYRQYSWWNGLFFRPNKKFLVNWEPSVGIGRIWRSSDGRFEDEWIRPNLYFRLPSQTDLSIQYLLSKERFGERVIPGIRLWNVNFNQRPAGWFSYGGYLSVGKAIRRDFGDPQLANQLGTGAFFSLKPTQRLLVEPNLDFSRQTSRRDDTEFFSGWILRTRVSYQFTRRFFARMIVQYNSFGEALDVEPLLTYRVNPFTVFYAGSTGNFQYFDADASVEDDIHSSSWKLADRQFFAKVQYLFQL